MNEKQTYIESLLKASDILVGLVSGTLKPVLLKQFKKSDGAEVYVYAHANGIVELEKSVDGNITSGGLPVEDHWRLVQTCQVALKHFFEHKDAFSKSDDVATSLARHSSVMKLKKTLNNSVGVVDAVTEWENRPGPKSTKPQTQFDEEARANRTKPIAEQAPGKAGGQKFADSSATSRDAGILKPRNK